VGGGAVLDVAGYAAAVAHRGVRLIRIPTTVLAQNDSGVGVKNGINAFGKKNFLGTFATPFAVINDSDFLSTLDLRDWRSGIAEAVKVALIKSDNFFESIEQSVDALNDRQQKSMEELIYQCARMHVEHIAAGDPFEQGSSRPLDFGHWSAHKLEQLSNYELRHGEAVAIGMALDCVYANQKGFLNDQDLQRILKLLRDLNFNLFHQTMLQDALLRGLDEFREHLGGKLTILLLNGIGSSFEVHDMDLQAIRNSIAYLNQFAVEPQS
jgi:3-dehydroquinate synthase